MKFTLDKSHFITGDKLEKKGSVELHKKSSDPALTDNNTCYSLAGAKYGLYLDGHGESPVATLVTDKNGYAKVENIAEGTYWLKELENPRGFSIDLESHLVVVNDETTARVDVTDTAQHDPVGILLQKKDAEDDTKGIPDAEFTVKYYKGNYDTNPAKQGKDPEKTWVLKTDEDGTVVMEEEYKVSGDEFYMDNKEVTYLPLGTVTIQETKAAVGYMINPEVFVRKIKGEGSEEVVHTYNAPTVPEIPQKVQIELSKVDGSTGEAKPQGAATLENAEYAVKDSDGQIVDTLITDKEGKAVSKELPVGIYTVQETKASNGYVVDSQTYKVSADSSVDGHSRVFQYKLTSPEEIIRGDVEIVKYIVNSDKRKETLKGLAGVEFTFTSNTTGKVVKKIVTDKDGFATTADEGHPDGSLIYDTYTVTETKCPKNVIPVEPFEVTISENKVTLTGIYKENHLILSPASILKKDKSTGLVIPVKDTEFRLLDKDKTPVVMTNDYLDKKKEVYETFKTDENGQFTFPERLEYGTYYLEELQSPKGYLKGEILEFKVTENADWEHPLIVEYEDDNAMGRIRIHKTDSSNGKNMNGVVFHVIAAEDIVTPDGTVRLGKGVVADTVITDAEGNAVSKDLYLGKYEVKEVQTLPGYVKDEKYYEVKLEYKDQETSIVEEQLEIKNNPTKLIITKKTKDKNEILKGVKFHIWNKDLMPEDEEKSKESGGETDEENSKDIYQTDENGEILIEYIKQGTYCIQEVETLPGYILDETVYEFTVNEKGEIEGNTLGVGTEGDAERGNDYTKLKISKQDATTGKELPGAELELIVKETGDVCEKWISGEEPHYVEAIPVGDYILRETKAPEGYKVATEVEFTVEETGEVKQVLMKDELLKEKKSPVKTGDSSMILGLIIVMFAAAAIFIFVSGKRKGHTEE